MSKLDPALALAVFALLAAASAMVLWPRIGLAARLRRRFGRSDTVLGEDLLKALFHHRASDCGTAAHVLGVAPAHLERVVGQQVALHHVSLSPKGVLELTERGRERAVQLVRAHRLWERYLADRTGLAEAEWHESAEQQEHVLSPAEADRLAARIGRPLVDPHGDPIPGAAGDVPELEGVALSQAGDGGSWEIVHLEDEPTDAYRRLVASGLAPGQVLEVTGRDGQRVRVSLEGNSLTFALADADSITVRRSRSRAEPHRSLASLRSGQSARVLALAATVHGPQRRRLLDLGFVPGTEVTAELRSAMGEPIAYRVRGALIALRHEQAAAILVDAA